MLELILFSITLGVGFIHVLWALKIWWPISEETMLAQATVGIKGVQRMPASFLAWLASFAIFFGSYVIALLAGWLPIPVAAKKIEIVGWVMSALLIIRAVYPYVFDRFLPQEAVFRKLNRRFYSPLILFLGLGILWLTLNRFLSPIK